MTTVAVLAKAPVSGRVKTRLCPPLEPSEAAALAEASLADTLGAVASTTCDHRSLFLDGDPGPWLPPGFTVVAQRGVDLAARLAHAFTVVAGPTILVGMDTPQATPELLERAITALLRPGTTSVLGLSDDGGYWAIGLRTPDPGVFAGVPTSTKTTGVRQLARLYAVGPVSLLPRLRDVDTFRDAVAVAALAPHSRFAAMLETLDTQRQLVRTS